MTGRFLLLHDDEELIACAYVKVTGDRAYLGMLSVDPARQKSGLGTRMMREAEAYARAAGCKALDIWIVNLRTELPPIYRKFGFVETGTEVSGMDREIYPAGSLHHHVERFGVRRAALKGLGFLGLHTHLPLTRWANQFRAACGGAFRESLCAKLGTGARCRERIVIEVDCAT